MLPEGGQQSGQAGYTPNETPPLLGNNSAQGSDNSPTTAQQQPGTNMPQEESNNPATGEDNQQSTQATITNTKGTVNPLTPTQPASQSFGGRIESGGSRFSSEDLLGEESLTSNKPSSSSTTLHRTSEDDLGERGRGINIPRSSYGIERSRPFQQQRQSLAEPSTVVEGSLRDNILNSTYTKTKNRLLAQDKIEEELETINEDSDSDSHPEDSDSGMGD